MRHHLSFIFFISVLSLLGGSCNLQSNEISARRDSATTEINGETNSNVLPTQPPIPTATPTPSPNTTVTPNPTPTPTPTTGPSTCNRSSSREVWAIHGQSNAQGEGTSPTSNLAASIAYSYRPTQQDIVPYQEPIGDFNNGLAASKTHNMLFKFAQDYHENTQHVVVATPVFRGATGLTREATGNISFINSESAPFNLLDLVLGNISGAKTASNPSDTFVIYAGSEYDAFALNSGELTKARFKEDFRFLINRLVSQVGMKKMFGCGVIRMFPPNVSGQPSNHSLGENLVFEAQTEIAAEMPNRFAVVYDCRNIPLGAPYRNSDSIHLSGFGQDFLGQAMADGILKNMGCK